MSATINNVYDNLYANLKNRFTVEKDSAEYTLGEYMLMKARAAKNAGKDLALVPTYNHSKTIVNVMNYVNDKLTVKRAPEKDKTLRAFPFRTSLAAFLSSALVCTVVFTYGILTIKNMSNTNGTPAVVEVEDEAEDIEKSNT